MRVIMIMASQWSFVLSLGLVIALTLSEVSGKRSDTKDRGESGHKIVRKSRGLWIGGDHKTGMDHGHGHGWMKLHNERHHDHSTKLSEAYVKFHGLGEKEKKGGGGFLGKIGNVLSQLGIGRGDPEEEANESGWGSNDSGNSGGGFGGGNGGNGGGWGGGFGGGGQEFITVSVHGKQRPMMIGGGGGGWGQPTMMQMQSGWANPQMQMVVAQPTGWASAGSQHGGGGGGGGGGGKGGNNGNSKGTGWASGDFASFKPPKGSGNKGHFQLNVPTGKPAYIQKLKPIIDVPKIHLYGLGWR